MKKGSSQRWRERRQKWVSARDDFNPGEFRVDIIPERQAKAFVIENHYSGTYPAARLACGLFRNRGIRAELAGACVFSVPMNNASFPKYLGSNEGAELGRLVLLDDVGNNGESWFVARAFRLLRTEKPDISGVISYSDPMPRHTIDGQLVTPGHVGYVYQGLNAKYAGQQRKRSLILAPNGTVLSERALSKVRNEERGWQYAMRQIIVSGGAERLPGEDLRSWLSRSIENFPRIRHPGNHLYLWGFSPQAKDHIEHFTIGNQYPKGNPNDQC